jgi:hypothetical protein
MFQSWPSSAKPLKQYIKEGKIFSGRHLLSYKYCHKHIITPSSFSVTVLFCHSGWKLKAASDIITVKLISHRFSENKKLNLLLWVIIHTEWTHASIIIMCARMLVAQHSHWRTSVGPIDKHNVYLPLWQTECISSIPQYCENYQTSST